MSDLENAKTPARSRYHRCSAISAQFCEPVERALQDEHRGVLVDHFGAAGAADVHPDQFALDG
jgi:hypothetical protein